MRNLLVLCMMVHHLFGDAPSPVSTQSFIIKESVNKKKYSTNELKEKLGSATESTFDYTTHVTEHLGKMQVACAQHAKSLGQESVSIHGALGRIQQTVACMQRRCSSVVKKLIDDQVPFKKAKKPMLNKALEVLTMVRDDLAHVTEQLKAWYGKMQNSLVQIAPLKASVEGCEKKIASAHAMMQQNECLQHV